MNDWVKNSLRFSIPENEATLIYLSIVLGTAILGHSFYLHRKKWKTVRIANDVAAFSLIGQALCFMRCSMYVCTISQQELFNNLLANALFGAAIQVADNFMTFSRYSVVCGGASQKHKIMACLWVASTLYATWWEMFTIFPFFFDMNSAVWVRVNTLLGYITISSYFAFDMLYLLLLVPFLVKADNQVLPSSRSQHEPVYRVFAAKAVGHTLLSMASICMYVFNFPDGIMEQNLTAVIAIHVFLNWSNSHTLLYKLKSIGGFQSLGRNKSRFKIRRVQVYASKQSPPFTKREEN